MEFELRILQSLEQDSDREINDLFAVTITVLQSEYIFTKVTVHRLVVAAKEIGLAVNADKTKYMVVSRTDDMTKSHYEG